MKSFYKKSIVFWFVLLIVALINATIRETTYKPFLTPIIGMWAHQISALTGILLFFGAIYFFLKKIKDKYLEKDLIYVGFIWIFMTIIFETLMNVFLRKLEFSKILESYYFWKGEMWIFVLLSLVVSPLIIYRILKRNK